MRGKIGLILLVLAIAAGLAYGFMPRPIPVVTAVAQRGLLEVTVDEEGKTRVRERYAVSAPVAGYARRIDLKVGDPVRAGQVVAEIEPARSADLDPRSRAQATAQLAAAKAAFSAAQENVRAAAAEERLAKQEYDRTVALGQARFLSQSAVDQARSRLQAAQANRLAAGESAKVAEHDVAAARAVLGHAAGFNAGKAAGLVKVASPIDGSVLAVPHESEGSVQAGQSLIEVGNPRSLEIVVEVLSTAGVKIAPGTPVRLERWGGDQPLEARVREVEPAGFTKISALGVEEQRVRVICDFTSPAKLWQRLADGYRVEASFVIWSSPDALQVPTDALFRYKDGWGVFVMEQDRARLRPVEVGQRNGLHAQILSGLKAGEKVISRPSDEIKDGSRVKERSAG